jgi:transposase
LPIDGPSFRRVEILTGAPRRRRWSAAEKAAIVAESFAPGAVSSTIALCHGLHRNQLYAWRHAWRRELRSRAAANAGVSMPDFVPVVAESRVGSGAAAIEIAVGAAVVRAGPGVDLTFLGEIIRLLKVTA